LRNLFVFMGLGRKGEGRGERMEGENRCNPAAVKASIADPLETHCAPKERNYLQMR